MLNKSVYLAVATFILGFIAAALLFNGEIRYAFSSDAVSLDSPSENIGVNDIDVFEDRAVINKEGLIWARVKDTHSMEPSLNENSISLELPPSTSSEIDVGDVISFSKKGKVIIHRVISVGDDGEWFAKTKGDNNKLEDPWKVRFEDIEGVMVGVLY